MKLDLFGQAIFDCYHGKKEPLITSTDISEEDELDLSYLFRTYKNMPTIEKKALQLCQGKILDIGAGTGCHALYLQNKNFDVKVLDASPLAIAVCQKQGLTKTVCSTLLDFETHEKFDTILLLMNGTGIFQTLNQVLANLEKLKNLLAANGQVLIDSSDLIYMFDKDDDGGVWLPAHKNYYGELDYTLHYKNQTETFHWLYLDADLFRTFAQQAGLNFEIVSEGKNFDYLARLSNELPAKVE
jgi:SAM-dependent methyltransferase